MNKWHCGCSFRLGLRGLALGLTLLVAFDAALHSAAHSEGGEITPKNKEIKK